MHPVVSRLLIASLGALISLVPAVASVATSSSGTVTILRDGAQVDGASALNSPLAPGTIITTGEDGMVSIEISPGSTIQLQPNTQITIGETRMDRAVSDAGDPV
ncbi:MAG: hypothetical protein ACKOAL_04550, partial [Chthoniobacterales bacterium]